MVLWRCRAAVDLQGLSRAVDKADRNHILKLMLQSIHCEVKDSRREKTCPVKELLVLAFPS